MASWGWGTKNEDAAKRCDYEAREYRREEWRARARRPCKRCTGVCALRQPWVPRWLAHYFARRWNIR